MAKISKAEVRRRAAQASAAEGCPRRCPASRVSTSTASSRTISTLRYEEAVRRVHREVMLRCTSTRLHSFKGRCRDLAAYPVWRHGQGLATPVAAAMTYEAIDDYYTRGCGKAATTTRNDRRSRLRKLAETSHLGLAALPRGAAAPAVRLLVAVYAEVGDSARRVVRRTTKVLMGDEGQWEPARGRSRLLPVALGLLAVVVLARLVGPGDDTALPIETEIPTPTPAPTTPTPTPSPSRPDLLPTPSLVSAPCADDSSGEPASTTLDPSWGLLAPPPLPVGGGGVLVTADDRLYVINDAPERSFLRMAVIGRDDGVRWACTPDAPVQTREGASAVWTGSEVIVYGGMNSHGALHDGAAYEPVQRRWRTLPPSAVPSPPTPAVRAWTGDELILWGSTGRDSPGGPHGVAYSPARDTWRNLRPAPHAMNMAASAWTGTELLVVGTALDTQNAAVARIAAMAYDPGTDEWRTLADPPDLLPQALTGAWDGNRLVVWDYGLTAAAYDPRTDEWASLADLPLRSAECYPEAVAMTDGMVFASYCGQYALLSDDGWEELTPPESAASFGTSPNGMGVAGPDVFLLGLQSVLRYTPAAAATSESTLRPVPDWTVLAADVATSPGVRRFARDASELAEAWAAASALTDRPTVPAGMAVLVVSVPSSTCRARTDVLDVEVTAGRIVMVLDDDSEFTRPCPGPADAPRGTVFAVAIPLDWLPDHPEVSVRTAAR